MIPTLLAGILRGGASAPPPPPPAKRYWRLTVTGHVSAGTPNTGSARISEWHLYSGATPLMPLSAMTDYNAPSPYVVTESSHLTPGSFEAWRAFTGDTTDASRWASASGAPPHWIQMDMGAGADLAPTQARVAPDGAVSIGYYISAFRIDASDTGSFAGEEVNVLTVSGLVQGDWTNNTLKNFSI